MIKPVFLGKRRFPHIPEHIDARADLRMTGEILQPLENLVDVERSGVAEKDAVYV
jgi:hypothetical protein|tara:strand:+ start:86 stop:250 length:165 start_codon:yes stop_codon:yes gene_type:complete